MKTQENLKLRLLIQGHGHTPAIQLLLFRVGIALDCIFGTEVVLRLFEKFGDFDNLLFVLTAADELILLFLLYHPRIGICCTFLQAPGF